MKNFLTLLCVSLTIMLMGCTNDNSMEEPMINDTNEYNDLLLAHLILSDNRYVLELSEDDALSEGIPLEVYNHALELVEDVNTSIEEAELKGWDLVLADPQAEYEIPVDMVKTRAEAGETISYGMISLGPSTISSHLGISPKTECVRVTARGSSLVWAASLRSYGSINMVVSGFTWTTDTKEVKVKIGSREDVEATKTAGDREGYILIKFEGV